MFCFLRLFSLLVCNSTIRSLIFCRSRPLLNSCSLSFNSWPPRSWNLAFKSLQLALTKPSHLICLASTQSKVTPIDILFKNCNSVSYIMCCYQFSLQYTVQVFPLPSLVPDAPLAATLSLLPFCKRPPLKQICKWSEKAPVSRPPAPNFAAKICTDCKLNICIFQHKLDTKDMSKQFHIEVKRLKQGLIFSSALYNGSNSKHNTTYRRVKSKYAKSFRNVKCPLKQAIPGACVLFWSFQPICGIL